MKLHIFDNGLISKSGHHFEYTISIYNEWTRQGGEAIIYSTVRVDEDLKRGYTIVPLFTHHICESYSPILIPILSGILNVLVGNYFYLKDLRKLYKTIFSKDDVVLIHSISHSMLLAIYLWYLSLPKNNLPRLVLLFRYSNIIYGPTKRYLPTYIFYKLMFKMFDRSPRRERIEFATDSEDLAKEYGEITKKTLTILPIPHIPTLHHGDITHQNNEQATTFVYAGEARDDKGYYLLPEAIRFVFSRNRMSKIRFIIQSTLAMHPGQQAIQAKRELSTLGEGVIMIDRILGTKEYYDLISQADAVLIPCRASEYYARTSGIFAETLALGKPVIIPRNTWMERQLSKYGGGGITFEDNDPVSLGQAILSFLEKKYDHKKRAVECAKKWAEYHNARSYVDILMDFTRKRE